MADVQYREVTVAAVGLGILQGILMTVAFVYAGLKLGFSLGGSTIAAIMGFALLKGVLGKGTIVENNINQTIASGINTTGAGVIFTLPVLYMMGIEFNYFYMLLASIAGSFLGVTVIIPLRKQMIDFDRLRFPSGTAVSAILKSPGAGVEKAILLASGFFLSFLNILAIKYQYIPAEISLDFIGYKFPVYTQTAISISLMNIGAGLLSGWGGLPFALGGCLAFWFLAPVGVTLGFAPAAAALTKMGTNMTDYVYLTWLRPIGIGMLIGGALMGVIMAFPSIKGAVAAIAKAAKSKNSASEDEMSINYIYAGCILSVVLLFLVTWFAVPGVSITKAFVISIIGSVWIALAGVIVAQCCGATDISPLSGLSLIAVTLMMALSGNNVLAAILIGLAVCVATSQCADMMQDLKTGFMIGGIPVKQQFVQVAVAWIGPIVALFTLAILWQVPPVTEGAVRLALAKVDEASYVKLDSLKTENKEEYTYITANLLKKGQSSDKDKETIKKFYRIHIKNGNVEVKDNDIYKEIGVVNVKELEKKGGTKGFGPGTKLPAPQAGALQAMVEGVKSGNAPINKYVTGGLLGGVLSVLPVGGLGVLIGLAMYLPFAITLGYGVGCVIAIILEKIYSAPWCEDKLVPFAAGLIVGEALTELGFSIYKIYAG